MPRSPTYKFPLPLKRVFTMWFIEFPLHGIVHTPSASFPPPPKKVVRYFLRFYQIISCHDQGIRLRVKKSHFR